MNINPELIGLVAGGLSSALFVPQIVKILREKSAVELSVITCTIGVISSLLWLWFGIEQQHISMIITNSISAVATMILLFLKITYNKEKT